MSRNLILARSCKACMPIIVSRTADRVVCFAVWELKRYLQKISKATFTIKKCNDIDISGSFSAIVVGAGEWEKRLDFNLDPACTPFDGFTIRSFQNKLFIRGVNSRSSLYGVYALLEKLGCEFVEPGIEYVPELKTITLSGINIKEVSAFVIRNIYRAGNSIKKKEDIDFLNPDVNAPQIDWMAKKRLNHYVFYVNHYRYDLWERDKHKVLDELLNRGFDIEVTHHSIHYFCPPDENHDFGGYGPETYLRNHPDWYVPAMECGARGRWQTRVNLPEVQKIITRRYMEYAGRNPEIKITGLWPDDIPMNITYKGLGVTDGYMKFWNNVGKTLAKSFPEKRLATIAYFELIEPPKKVAPAFNLHQWFCPIERNYHYGINDKRNKKDFSYLKKWVKQMPPYHLGIFEYYSWQMELTPLLNVMRNDMQAYRDLGVGGIYSWSAGYPDNILNILGEDYRWAMDIFGLTHILWNPQADIEGLRQIWVRNVFDGSASCILDFYDLLGKEHKKELRKKLAPNYQWISLDLMHMCQKLLASARRKAGSQRVMDRIDLLEKVLVHGSAEKILREGKYRVV